MLLQGLLGARTSESLFPTFGAAALAGATSCVTLHPLEVVRSRLTCDTRGQYKGLLSATRHMLRSEGVGSFYRGLGPALLAVLPEAAVTYGKPSCHAHSQVLASVRKCIRQKCLPYNNSKRIHFQDLFHSHSKGYEMLVSKAKRGCIAISLG